ncbi:MAG: precorrin-2 C(20)-methyltransferase [Desulfomonile tiedjei]|nr:precorrin-2 C(20)-methyltransferase [Desulfomonile tiedjei]
MKQGILYGIGIGPGDPELITVKGARLLARCQHVFVPKAPPRDESLALSIAKQHIPGACNVTMIEFPMTKDREKLRTKWEASTQAIASVLRTGEDACYLTLGDTLMYSTYIYMLKGLRTHLPDAKVVTVPGVTAFSAAAALVEFPIGVGQEPVTVVPISDDLEALERALLLGGTVILMKIGKRFGQVLKLLETSGHIDNAILVSRAGLAGERIETDLRNLAAKAPDEANLSVILVHAFKGEGG